MTLDYPAEKPPRREVSPEEGRSHNTSDSSPNRVATTRFPISKVIKASVMRSAMVCRHCLVIGTFCS